MARGRFISFEGGEGAGKTTQIALLAEHLRERRALRVVATREPGGTPGAEEIRNLLVAGKSGRWSGVAEALLVNAARADHTERLIRPALERGEWVLCDRYVHSTLAYQGAARDLEEAGLRSLHAFSTGDLWPDLTVYLAMPAQESLERARTRAEGAEENGRFEGEEVKFHERVRQGFERLAETDERMVAFDAAADVDRIAGQIWDVVTERLPCA